MKDLKFSHPQLLTITRIKWDDSVENVTLTQTWGAEFIHFNNAKKILSKIKTASSMLLELDWYGEGHVYFKFPLNGASEAIAEILKCE